MEILIPVRENLWGKKCVMMLNFISNIASIQIPAHMCYFISWEWFFVGLQLMCVWAPSPPAEFLHILPSSLLVLTFSDRWTICERLEVFDPSNWRPDSVSSTGFMMAGSLRTFQRSDPFTPAKQNIKLYYNVLYLYDIYIPQCNALDLTLHFQWKTSTFI